MSAALITGLTALAAAFVAAAFAYLTSRKTSDDSRAIGLINAGQVALEQALERATQEIMDARAQLSAVRAELASVRRELADVLRTHEDCEEERRQQAREVARLAAELTKAKGPI